MTYKLVQCCPVPEQLAPILERIAQRIGCTYASIYRGTDARDLLAQCGKHDQLWLWQHLGPGVANPPGRSTHELRNDGVAYSGPVGQQLEWWQCGIDVDDAHVDAFIREASNEGFIATITYPGSVVEHHHVNFRQVPVDFAWCRPGDWGQNVSAWSHRLVRIKFLNPPRRLHFGKAMERSVREFQRRHHLTVDGIIGPQTGAQIMVTQRHQEIKEGK